MNKLILAPVAAIMLSGCAILTVHRHPAQVVTSASGAPVIADGGWSVTYHKLGIDTSLGSLNATVGTNGIMVVLSDLNSVVSTNLAPIVEASAEGVARGIAAAALK